LLTTFQYDQRPELFPDMIKCRLNPEKNVNRKVCKILFGMIIIDEKEVSVELIDQLIPRNSTWAF
jgi:hypothetical protein